jgi:hypothetical protein
MVQSKPPLVAPPRIAVLRLHLPDYLPVWYGEARVGRKIPEQGANLKCD